MEKKYYIKFESDNRTLISGEYEKFSVASYDFHHVILAAEILQLRNVDIYLMEFYPDDIRYETILHSYTIH